MMLNFFKIKKFNFFEDKRLLSIYLMILGSVLISFNGLVLRKVNFANAWTIMFYRAVAFSLAIFFYIIFKNKNHILKEIVKIGSYGLLAGFVLGLSNIFFILSITSTSVANTVFTISLIPFITAFLALLILKEKLAKITIYTMICSLIGLIIMFHAALQIGVIWGNILALLTAICFSTFTIILRLNKKIDMLPCLLVSGIIVIGLSYIKKNGSLEISLYDFSLCFLLGGIMSGFVNCCFVFATRHLIASEATLFFFIEIVLSPFWVWIFLNEITEKETLIGGIIILSSLLIRALYSRLFINN